jgi:hypothetical protein
MNLKRHIARLSALATAVTVIWSCDSRIPTASTGNATDDVDRPSISFALSSGANNVVDIGAALSVTVTSTDNFGVGYVFTRISNGAQVLAIDTATIKPTQKSVFRTVPNTLGTGAKGDQLTIRAPSADGPNNPV